MGTRCLFTTNTHTGAHDTHATHLLCQTPVADQRRKTGISVVISVVTCLAVQNFGTHVCRPYAAMSTVRRPLRPSTSTMKYCPGELAPGTRFGAADHIYLYYLISLPLKAHVDCPKPMALTLTLKITLILTLTLTLTLTLIHLVCATQPFCENVIFSTLVLCKVYYWYAY